MRRPAVLVIALFALAATPASASAAIEFQITESRWAEANRGAVAVWSMRGNSVRFVVERAGAAVAEASSDGVAAGAEVLTANGDVVKIFQPASATTPAATVPLSSELTLGQACAGKTSFTGTQSPAPTDMVIGAGTFAAFSNRSDGRNRGRVTRTAPGTYRADLRRPIVLGEMAYVEQLSTRGNAGLRTYIQKKVEDCSVLPTDGLVSFSARRDVKPLPTGVQVRLTCAKASRIPCAGVARLSTPGARAAAAKPAGSKPFTIAPGKSKRVTVKLTRSALRTLKRKRRLTVTLTVATKNQDGATLSKSAKVTLKLKRRKR